jgi:circadian clock protein KaiC
MEGNTSPGLAPTGIDGFDDILRGGLTAGKMHLLSGSPGTGKTTFALHFIAEGIRRGERCLYITVGGSEKDFIALAEIAGISLPPDLFSVHMVEISREILDGPERRIFHSAETEPAGAIKDLLAEITGLKPKRLVIDSLSDLRLLAEDEISYRRLVLALRQEFNAEECTVLLLNNVSASQCAVDLHLEIMCHGVVHLEQVIVGFGPIRRRLLVVKVRGRAYRSGWHDFRIVTGAIKVFPTLIASEHREKRPRELIASGNAGLDLLLGGGLERGSAAAIIGAAGTGKTTVANHFVVAAAKSGEHVAVYLFDETEESYRERATGLGLSVDAYTENGLILLQQVNAAEFSVGEFSAQLRQEVEGRGVRTVVIDTLSGYANALPDERYMAVHLHELLTFLSHKGVTTILTVEQHGVFGVQALELKNASYLADTILLLRFFEHRGKIRRALSVVKKRRGPHESTIRELTFSANGIVVGEPLEDMQGVLMGVPVLDL